MKLLKDIGDKNKTAEILEIPLKNIKRWEKNGIYRKEGSRKANDPEMEVKLKKWILEFESFKGKMPKSRVIKNMALQFSNFKGGFKASKGWYEKFVLRSFGKNFGKGNNKGRFREEKNCFGFEEVDLRKDTGLVLNFYESLRKKKGFYKNQILTQKNNEIFNKKEDFNSDEILGKKNNFDKDIILLQALKNELGDEIDEEEIKIKKKEFKKNLSKFNIILDFDNQIDNIKNIDNDNLNQDLNNEEFENEKIVSGTLDKKNPNENFLIKNEEEEDLFLKKDYFLEFEKEIKKNKDNILNYQKSLVEKGDTNQKFLKTITELLKKE